MEINFIQQFKHFWNVILVLIIVLNLVFLGGFLISSIYSLPINFVLEDPASLYGFNQFSGFVASFGFWILASGIGAVLLLLFLAQKLTIDKKDLTGMVVMGLMTFFLLLDDAFLLHERVFTGIFHVGERTIFLVYFLILGALLFYFRHEFMTGATSFLIISVLLFGLSISMDVLADKGVVKDSLIDNASILEEYFKLGGYLFWTTFIMIKARTKILSHLDQD